MKYPYHHAVVGGTFDHFHRGHEALIDTAVNQAGQVTFGLSTPKLYAHKLFSHTIEDYKTREEVLMYYLKKISVLSRTTIVPLTDIYGTLLTDKTIDLIVISAENAANVALVNKKRKEKGLPPVEVLVVPYVTGSDGKTISSERIRSGEIDRQGHAYMQLFLNPKGHIMPESLQDTLRVPLGTVVSDTTNLIPLLEKNQIIICVGDVITESCIAANIPIAVSIVDFKTRRHPLNSIPQSTKKKLPKNPQGTIQQEAVAAYQKALITYLATKETQIVCIDGEEDLLALPAILLAPLGSLVLYGQYGLGIVANTVTEALKERVSFLLQQFD